MAFDAHLLRWPYERWRDVYACVCLCVCFLASASSLLTIFPTKHKNTKWCLICLILNQKYISKGPFCCKHSSPKWNSTFYQGRVLVELEALIELYEYQQHWCPRVYRIDLQFFRLIPVIQDTIKFQLHVCKSCLLPKIAEVHYDTYGVSALFFSY